MTSEIFKSNRRSYLLLVVAIAAVLWIVNHTYSIGWLIGNGVFTLSLYYRVKFYTAILSWRENSMMLIVPYELSQLAIVAIPIFVALTTKWFNIFAFLLGYMFYKFGFVYLGAFRKGSEN